MNRRGGWSVLYCNFTDRTWNNIFLGGGIKFRRYFFEFRTKILKIPPDFLKSVSKSIGKKMSENGRIGFATSIGDSIGNCATDQAV
jgi:hypothetical protein